MHHIILLALNIFQAVIISFFIILCESRKVIFWEFPDISNPDQLPPEIAKDQKYCELLAKYKDYCNAWQDPKGDGIAKCLTAFLVMIHFSKTIRMFSETNIRGAIFACLSILLILYLVLTAKKNLQAYRKFQYNGKGQASFQLILFDFYKEADKYSYIEKCSSVASMLNDKDSVIHILESRIAAMQSLQAKSFDYSRDWLIFSALHAMFLIWFDFM